MESRVFSYLAFSLGEDEKERRKEQGQRKRKGGEKKEEQEAKKEASQRLNIYSESDQKISY